MCDHYERYCDIKCDICNEWFACRKCHDNKIAVCGGDVHIANYSNITRIKCRQCQTEQPPNITCQNCQIQLGNFYCLRCRYYGNKQNYHCDVCNCCYLSSSHKCKIGDICCICLEDDNEIRTVLPCGHVIHRVCYIKLGNSNHNNCPLCRSIVRKVLLCDLCHENILDKGYAAFVSKLHCGHNYHNHCISNNISCVGDVISATCPVCGKISTINKKTTPATS